jgi:hypothetical protein
VHGGLAPNFPYLTPYPSRINDIASSLLYKLQARPQVDHFDLSEEFRLIRFLVLASTSSAEPLPWFTIRSKRGDCSGAVSIQVCLPLLIGLFSDICSVETAQCGIVDGH